MFAACAFVGAATRGYIHSAPYRNERPVYKVEAELESDDDSTDEFGMPQPVLGSGTDTPSGRSKSVLLKSGMLMVGNPKSSDPWAKYFYCRLNVNRCVW